MENNWVDFRTIKAAVSLQMVLDHYEVNWLRKSNDELRGRCPIHKGEGQDTFHANLTKNAFQCFSCKTRGNVLDFVAAMEECSVRAAAQKLQQWFSSAVPLTTAPVQSKAGQSGGVRAIKNDPLQFQLKGIEPDHPYLAARGISKKTAEEFGIGYYCGKGSMSGRIVIPIHDEHGDLLAYAGRAIDDSEPKYKLPAGFHKSLELYNLHRAIERSKERAGTVVVVEGFFGCINVHVAGHPCVALMGCSLSSEQESLMCRTFKRVAVLLDGDDPGKQGTDDCLLRLGRKIWATSRMLPSGKQPDQLTVEDLRGLLQI
jgi:DNA primase